MFTNVVFVENLAQCRTQLWVLIAAHNSERTLPHSILDKYGICWKCSSILPTYLTYLLACDLCHNKFTLKRFLKTHIQAIQASATKKCFFYSCCKKFTLDRFLKILSSHTGARRQFFVTFCDIHDFYTWPAYLPELTLQFLRCFLDLLIKSSNSFQIYKNFPLQTFSSCCQKTNSTTTKKIHREKLFPQVMTKKAAMPPNTMDIE